MDSPWGVEWSILKETGWTRHYLLWKISWRNVRLMVADAPRFSNKKHDDVIVDPDFNTLNRLFDE